MYARTTIVAALIAATATAAAGEITGPDVLSAMRAEGAAISSPQQEDRAPDSPLPNSFDERWTFEDADLGNGDGGQFFICRKPAYCDALQNYFEALAFLAGPYLYRSADGLILVQLSASHSPDSAERYAKALERIAQER